jgi:hypothetical protein
MDFGGLIFTNLQLAQEVFPRVVIFTGFQQHLILHCEFCKVVMGQVYYLHILSVGLFGFV